MKKEEIKKAAALSFNPIENSAPKIIAKGEGEMAEMILDRANASGIPVMEKGDLADWLVELPVGVEIPEKMYKAVSVIFAHLYELKTEAEGQ